MRDNAKSGALTEVTFFILLALYTPKHGYGIMQFVEDQTKGRLILGAGSLYGAIKTLQARNWIVSVNEDNERKNIYIITETGKKIAASELSRLNNLIQIAQEITGGQSE